MSTNELNSASIKKLKVGELKAELSKRNPPIFLGRKDELAKRLLKVVNHGLPKSDEDGHAAMAVVSDTINTHTDAEGEANKL